MTFIAHEHFQQIRGKDLIFLGVMSFICALIIYLSSWLTSPSITIIVSIFSIVCLSNLLIYISRKSSMVLLFYVLVSFLTFGLDDFGVTGWRKLMVFLIAGIVFEIIYLTLKLRIHNVSLDMVVGSTLAMMSIPLLVALFISPNLVFTFPEALINLILLGFTFGLISSVITSIVWHFIRANKFILDLETKLMTLGKV
jgi:hypothetical protein